jgi:probable F420-dependent oxidoreductase
VNEFRFGVHAFAPSGREEWVEVARQGEAEGFSVLTVPDHLIDGCISPFAALGVAAEATSTLRLGTLVLNNELRHPAIVAREVLALDALSEGRVELGIGAGSTMSSSELESIGRTPEDGAARVARLGEAVEMLDELLRGNDVSFEGEHYELNAHHAWPPAVQRPRPPILVGGHGRTLLRIAAATAEIVGISGPQARPLGPKALDERFAFVRAASGGREFELQALVQQVVITDDPRAAAEDVRQSLPELGVEDVLGSPYLWVGTVESICEQLLGARERWGLSYFTVFHHALHEVAPIVTRLAGT